MGPCLLANVVSRLCEIDGVVGVDEVDEETGCSRQGRIGLDTTPIVNLGAVVRYPILSFRLRCVVVVIASQWPCWLIPVLSLRLPLAGA